MRTDRMGHIAVVEAAIWPSGSLFSWDVCHATIWHYNSKLYLREIARPLHFWPDRRKQSRRRKRHKLTFGRAFEGNRVESSACCGTKKPM